MEATSSLREVVSSLLGVTNSSLLELEGSSLPGEEDSSSLKSAGACSLQVARAIVEPQPLAVRQVTVPPWETFCPSSPYKLE